MILSLIPAYGRRYGSKEEALTDWFGGKDWRILRPTDGSYCSIRDVDTIQARGHTHIMLYHDQTLAHFTEVTL
jgi:hypothetical protein